MMYSYHISSFMRLFGKLRFKSRKNITYVFMFFMITMILFMVFPKPVEDKLTNKSNENNNNSLTIICLPYPVSNEHTRDRYLITMSSWLLTAPTTKVLILMPPYEFDPNNMIMPLLTNLFGNDRIIFGPSIETDEDGVPFIDEWFIKGLDAAETPLICWINADIITPKGWLPRINYLYNYFYRNDQQFSVISRRCDFDYPPERASEVYNNILYSNGTKSIYWPPDFDEIASSRSLHSTWGIDFFLIAKEPMQINFDEIPPFHLGKYRWDPWITGWLRKHMPLISLGNDFCTYHLNHIPKARKMEDIKVKENFENAKRHGNFKVPNGLASYFLQGRYLYQKDKTEPLDKIDDSIPEPNAPPDSS
ncbi:hypothetical protein TRFO_39002 [Tritrichomonas foetus]|uniref:Uncharacterized protein n=1 Tax=Tritrichomonas foetus TaxID=1144522 RepID=A0A1J4JBK0_9EUKA|nr:hypothetical protein TRFO_39002 [Tritrichomonas foetus]|eukprot:OHS94813.1 hypothetical protein TRFO_39002 [Tritrichomonas foetus]